MKTMLPSLGAYAPELSVADDDPGCGAVQEQRPRRRSLFLL